MNEVVSPDIPRPAPPGFEPNEQQKGPATQTLEYMGYGAAFLTIIYLIKKAKQ